MNSIALKFAVAAMVASIIPATYVIPHKENVIFTGTDVVLAGKNDSENVDAKERVRDVRVIYGKTPDGKVRTYHNEDSPWHFKFDSGTETSLVNSILHEQSQTQKDTGVVVSSYGWRIEILSMYPNIISIEKSDEKTGNYFYWIAMAFVMLFSSISVYYIVNKIFVLFGRAKEKVVAEIGDMDNTIAKAKSGLFSRLFGKK